MSASCLHCLAVYLQVSPSSRPTQPPLASIEQQSNRARLTPNHLSRPLHNPRRRSSLVSGGAGVGARPGSGPCRRADADAVRGAIYASFHIFSTTRVPGLGVLSIRAQWSPCLLVPELESAFRPSVKHHHGPRTSHVRAVAGPHF